MTISILRNRVRFARTVGVHCLFRVLFSLLCALLSVEDTMDNKDKGLNRGGTLGQEAEIDPQQPRGDLNQRDQQKQRGGLSREPNLEKKDKKDIQPTHVVD